MAVNFYANRDDIVNAWKDVLDDKSSYEWAVFGYVKQSNDLEVVSKGTGLDDLSEEFNSCKILYALVRLIDPNTELIKFILINWQGEGAPIARKGVCANHQNDVKGFFKGVHITINARTEEEVEPSAILSKISKSMATKLNLKDRTNHEDLNPVPVSSNYKRVQASAEINNSARESFWNQQQEEEKRRKIEEKKRLEEERLKAAEAEKAREVVEAKEREKRVLSKEHEINLRREEEKNAENRARNLIEKDEKLKFGSVQQKMEKPKLEAKPTPTVLASQRLQEEEDPEEERSKRSELARRARAEEAKQLISGSSVKNARALFESNTSAGQLNEPTKQSINVAPRRKLTPMIVSNGNATTKETPTPKETPTVLASKVSSHVENANGDAKNQLASIKETPINLASERAKEENIREPAAADQNHGAEDDIEEEDEEEDVDDEEGEYDMDSERVVYASDPMLQHQQSTTTIEQHALEDIQEEAEEDEAVYDKNHPIGDQGLRARALYDYQAADETEISFDPDDILTHVDKIDPGWYQGFAPDGSYGLFPANYVELLDD